jgi:hypothetical protein
VKTQPPRESRNGARSAWLQQKDFNNMISERTIKLIGVLFLMMIAALLLPVNAWAGGLDKSSSLTINKDSTEGWTAICAISVGGVDKGQTYSGRMIFFVLASGGAPSTTIFDVLFQVDPANRVSTQSSPGIYEVTATLRGSKVAVHAEVPFDSISSGDSIFCGSRIDPGTQPPVVGTTLFETLTRTNVDVP